uniref:Nuclear speckle splicing regulatory protein 1 n=1 Tax=Takifugu rubripes TaxID=31033 RepID=H2RK32_TAKRU
MAVPTKQYGLILPQKKGLSKTSVLQKPSVFGDDSDEETTVGQSLLKEAAKKKTMKQTRLEMQKALEQDSTVYDYDAVYDEIQNQRLEKTQKILHGSDKRPKYIHQLMKAVDDRKKEQERREERKIQKEREAEGEKFADKEAYVTSAYKKKLEEQKEELEREKRAAALEAALDVKKQKDLSGFYRHFLNQTVGEEAIPDRSVNKMYVCLHRSQPSNLPKDVDSIKPEPSSKSQDLTPSSGSDSEERKPGFSKSALSSSHSKRQYRQRSPSSDSELEREKDRHKKSHRDRDRDRAKDRDRDRHRDRDRDRDRKRERERDDRHRGRRDDRERRTDRDRSREDDRSREKRDDRHQRRDRSPREREREKSGEREKPRHTDEDERKDKDQGQERKEPEKEAKRERKDSEKDTVKDEQKQEGEEKEETEEKGSKFAKRSTDQTVSSARERYLARQMTRSAAKPYVEKDED